MYAQKYVYSECTLYNNDVEECTLYNSDVETWASSLLEPFKQISAMCVNLALCTKDACRLTHVKKEGRKR